MKRILIFAFCLLFSTFIFAQDQGERIAAAKAEILTNQLNKVTSDTAKVRLTTELSSAYFLASKFDSCKKYAAIAFTLNKKIPLKGKSTKFNLKYKKLKATALQNFGSALSFESSVPALVTLKGALVLWLQTGDKNGIARAYFSIGQAYSIKGEKNMAIDYYNKSLALFEETQNEFNIANTLFFISLEKRYLGNFGDALEFSIKSLKVAQKNKDTLAITNALLANGFNYMYAKKFPEARAEQRKALKIFEKRKDSNGIATVYNDLGTMDLKDNKLEDALKNNKIALQIRKNMSDLNAISISYNYIATIYRRLGKLPEALAAQKAGIPYALKFGDSRFIMNAYSETGDIYMDLKDYKNALSYYKLEEEVAKKNNAKSYQAEALVQIGQAHRAAGNIKEALTSLHLADEISMQNEFSTREQIYKAMTETYLQNNDYKNGYLYQVKFQQMRDSANAIEKAEKITSLTQNLIYENKRALQQASQDKEIAVKESQITEQKFIRNISIAGLLIGLILAVVFFIRFKEKRNLNVALEKSLTDLKITQNQLVQSEKMASLGELTAGIAHEIQNPLNFVNNFAEVSVELLQEMQDEINTGNFTEAKDLVNDVVENLNKIKHHGKRADSIVKGMLQHSRKSSGKKELVDLNAICEEYLRLSYHGLRAQDKTFNATINSDFDESIGEVNLLPQDFGRVILNLLTNAFYVVNEKKHSKLENYKPTVSISTKKIGHKIFVNVSDNGNGMPQHIITKIFQPFFTTKPTGKGTGLGLSLSYDIITKGHNGELKVESKENEGTTFTIELPPLIN